MVSPKSGLDLAYVPVLKSLSLGTSELRRHSHEDLGAGTQISARPKGRRLRPNENAKSDGGNERLTAGGGLYGLDQVFGHVCLKDVP
jgi:hypothetical protein